MEGNSTLKSKIETFMAGFSSQMGEEAINNIKIKNENARHLATAKMYINDWEKSPLLLHNPEATKAEEKGLLDMLRDKLADANYKGDKERLRKLLEKADDKNLQDNVNWFKLKYDELQRLRTNAQANREAIQKLSAECSDLQNKINTAVSELIEGVLAVDRNIILEWENNHGIKVDLGSSSALNAI